MLAAALALAALAAGAAGTWSPCGLSMVDTLRAFPPHAAARALACTTFMLGALAGGVATFGVLSAADRLAHGAGGDVATVVAVVLAAVAALGELAGVPIRPQIRRQVPEPWRRSLPLALAAALYGVLLGLGFTTFVLTLGVWALAGISVALAEPQLGLVVGLAFGAGRALPVAVLALLGGRPAGQRLDVLLAERPGFLRTFRVGTGVALGVCALALAGEAAAAAPVVVRGTDPTAAGSLLTWRRDGGAFLQAASHPAQAHHYLEEPTALPGTVAAVGGGLLAWSARSSVHVVAASDFSPVAELPLAGVDALAVSRQWLVYRNRVPDGGDRVAARPLGAPTRERLVAGVFPPAQLGRPALDGDRLVFHVATRRASEIVAVDLATGRQTTLRRSGLDQLSNPALLGSTLLYVRRTNLRQLLQIGPLRRGGRDRVVLRTASTADRDSGYEPGHSRVTLTPPAGVPARETFWTTALSPRYAYLTLLRGGDARIVRILRHAKGQTLERRKE